MNIQSVEPSKEDDNQSESNEQSGDLQTANHTADSHLIRRMTSGQSTSLTPKDVLWLQRTVGNQAVGRLLNERAPVSNLQRRWANPDELPSMPTDAVHSHRLNFLTIKLLGYGIDHWWIEIDGSESYGWWPIRDATDAGDAAWSHGIMGVPGELNAVSRPTLGGTATLDPHHGDSAPHTFHPYTTASSDSLTEDEIRQQIRAYARGFSGDYRIIGGPNCHTFISGLMSTVGLSRHRTSGAPILP